MKWRWSAIVGLSFVLSACDTFNPCSNPGVNGPAQCYHYLTITEKGLTASKFAKKMGLKEWDVSKMLDPRKPCRLDLLADALGGLGKHLTVSVDDAA